jgi:cold shock protein
MVICSIHLMRRRHRIVTSKLLAHSTAKPSDGRHRRVAAIPRGDPAHGVARNLALLTPQFSCCFVRQSDFGRSGRRPWAQSLRISPKAGLWRGSQRALPREDWLEARRQTMQKGTVKWFNPTKGYGFIRPSTGDKDVFVHISAVERAGLGTLNEGQVVEYELVTNRGKTSAENLKVSWRLIAPGQQPGRQMLP